MPRAEEGRFDDLLSVADVERLVSSGGLRTPGLRLVKEGGTIAEAEYAREISWRPKPFTGVVDPDRVAEAFDGRLDDRPPGASTTRGFRSRASAVQLESELGSGVQANSYYTPRRSQGFAVHHDTHDVFVLQVAGEKHWRVYEPLLELPLKAQRWSSSLGEPGPTVLELTLRAGDTLYLPRGWLHDALTSDTDSLHITVGINVPHLDRRVPGGARGVRRTTSSSVARCPADGEPDVDLVERLAARLDAEDVRPRARAKFVDEPPADPRRAARGGARARFGHGRHAARAPADRDRELAETTLSFEGKHLDVPRAARARSSRRSSQCRGPFTAAELPGQPRRGGPARARQAADSRRISAA